MSTEVFSLASGSHLIEVRLGRATSWGLSLAGDRSLQLIAKDPKSRTSKGTADVLLRAGHYRLVMDAPAGVPWQVSAN